MTKQNNIKQRTLWITNLRVLATISVILLHVASALTTRFGMIDMGYWWIGNVIEASVRFCVPVFVMLTGALFLSQDINIRVFFKKRLIRVFIPFLFWNIVYVFSYVIVDYNNGINITFSYLCDALINGLINGSAFHLWYVYMLIGLYLVIPIISKWIQNCTEKEILYFLFVWIITTMIVDKFDFLYNIRPIYYTGYIGYLVLGYYLSVKTFKEMKRLKKIVFSLFFLGVLVTMLGSYVLSKQQGVFSYAFSDYLTFNVLIASIGIFLFFRFFVNFENKYLSKMVSILDKYSYGIYLAHIFVLSSLSLFGITAYFINPLMAIPLRTLLCLGFSLLLVFFIDKLPFGKYISGS